jgi:hypothetical protein
VQRPDFNDAVTALIAFASATMPEFAHLQPQRILVVAGEARRASRGTVKPLAFAGGKLRDASGRKKPMVKFHGKRQLYCITLRPLFFRESTPRARVATILHELFHISKAFDGSLAPEHTHAELGRGFDKRFQPLERRLWRSLPPALREPFGWSREVRVLQWLERPGAGWWPGERTRMRTVYTQAQLFHGCVRMKTRLKPRA